MKYERRKNRNFDIIKVDFISDEEVVKKSEIQAERKSKYTHENDPSSSSRSEEEIYNAQLLGTIADISCYRVLRSYLEGYAEVERYDDIREDEFKNPDMFDIRIIPEKDSVKEKYVEVRSSVCNKIPLEPMLHTWHVLGWYSTGSKPGEEVKEFYMRPIYHYNNYDEGVEYELSDADRHIYNGNLDLYIVGGATKEMLKKSGYEDRGYGLLQEGATYQIIEITDSLGIEEFLEVIKERVSSDKE